MDISVTFLFMNIQTHVFFFPFHVVGQGILIRVVVCKVCVLGFLFPFLRRVTVSILISGKVRAASFCY